MGHRRTLLEKLVETLDCIAAGRQLGRARFRRPGVGSCTLRAMGDARPPEPAPGTRKMRRRKAAGTWVGSLIFALALLLLIFFDAQAVYQHQWVNVIGITVFTLLFLIVPTGGAKWLRRALRDRKSPR